MASTGLRVIVMVSVLMFGGAEAAAAPRVELDEPIAVRVAKVDRTIAAGELVAFDDQGFDLRREGQVAVVKWTELSAADVFMLHVRLLDRNGDAVRWLELGRVLRTMEGGKGPSDRALDQAVRVEPGLRELADEIRAAGAAAPARPAGGKPVETDAQPATADIPGKTWGALSVAERARVVDELKQRGEEARQKYAPRLGLIETDYFLFYTDLDAGEARKWATLLDKMYDRLCDMFAIPKGTNIWHGKALVFVFKDVADFRRFEAEVYDTRIDWAAGLCHQFSDGQVHICFYRPPDEARFAHVLVHESVHGFIHRYRSPARVANWANEGLAEWIAYELVPRPGGRGVIRQQAAMELRNKPDLGGMFEMENIEPAHYVQTTAITDVLIGDVSRRGYVQFINAMKDGERWQEAFTTSMGMSLDKFLAIYAKSIGLNQPIRK